jgi:hypothetical protein
MTDVGWGPNRNRLIKIISDFGGFRALFSAVIGAPSLLSLLELVTEYRLSPALQWIVDGYHWLTAVMALAVEPLVVPLIAIINSGTGWRLTLYPHWRPLFLLMMVFFIGTLRAAFRDVRINGRVAFRWVLIIVVILISALLAGLVAIEGRWWEQGLLALLPFSPLLPNIVAAAAGSVRGIGNRVAVVLSFSLLPFTFAVCLSFVPGFERSAGIATLAVLMATISVGVFAVAGIRDSDRSAIRAGFSMLGGFIVAGIILVADAIFKACT